jgi:DNA-directed RNA polymerase subunit M/transcription elongation factor TFIIS
MMAKQFNPNHLLIFCKKCGVVGTVNSKHVPYTYQCPKCGRTGKIRRRKYWSGNLGVGVPQLFLASSSSQAGAKMLQTMIAKGVRK